MAGEGQLLPGDIGRSEVAEFARLLSGVGFAGDWRFCKVEDVDDPRFNAGVDVEQPREGDSEAGLFGHFATGAFFQRLAQFEVAAGQGPAPALWLDGAPGEEDGAIFDD